MLGYRRTSFRKAHNLLASLRRDLSDFDSLLSLQRLLASEIMLAEGKVSDLRKRLKSDPNDAGVKRRLEGHRHVAYIWRCFGDAIAFLYMDRHALKHVFYNTNNVSPKQSAGFLGKEGMGHEIDIIEFAISNGVPAILSDLTNTIRHGDVCLMGGADPRLIEVKKSKKLNTRGKKQKKNVEKLQSFFETDFSQGLHGAPYTYRVAWRASESDYVSEMAACIDEAMIAGCGVRHPEPGLHYIAATSRSAVPRALSQCEMSGKEIFLLNEFKLQQTWSPYYPFTLSIKDLDHLFAFCRGDVYLVVAVDFSIVVKALRNVGHEAAFHPDIDDFPFRFVLSSGEMGAIGAHLLTRVGLEFLSPSTMALSSAEIYQTSIGLVPPLHPQGEESRRCSTMLSPEAWLRGDVSKP